MATALLEETRQHHEDMERLERLVVSELKQNVKTHREKLVQGHRVRVMLDGLQHRAQKLEVIYGDEDGSRKQEIADLRGDDVFRNFYARLKEVRDYHRKFPSDAVTEGDGNDALRPPLELPVTFSGEESLGRTLDLHELHAAFRNLPCGRELSYYDFVAGLGQFWAVSLVARRSLPFRRFMESVLIYLESFYQRTRALEPAPAEQWERRSLEWASAWREGRVPGWEDRGLGVGVLSSEAATSNGAASAEGDTGEILDADEQASSALLRRANVDLEAFESAADMLETLGSERLKAALSSLGLKCGGAPTQRAERLFSVRGLKLSHVPAAAFARGAAPAAALAAGERERRAALAREAAAMEARVGLLWEQLAEEVRETLGRVEKRQAQTYEELLKEQAEGAGAEELAEAPDSDDEAPVHNPLKLPLGWDGKPIPYWLYRLHGLNLEFKCQICGNASYWGRRAFERHFQETQHQQGMKALGIPNSKHFFEVTEIEDARKLWAELQERRKSTSFEADQDEEFEDAEGNVYKKKTWLDLKRQGLV